jgi:hypothetical protein
MDEFLARLARSSKPVRQQDLTLGRGHAERAAALHMIETPTDRPTAIFSRRAILLGSA